MKPTYLKAGVAVGLIMLGIYFGGRHFSASSPPTPAVAQLLGQSMPDAKGQSQALSRWKGKTLIVNFWATWCAPCVKEMPELSALQAEVASKNIQLIGIGIDSAANIAEFSSKYAIGYPLYVAGMDGSELSRQFGNDAGALPFTVLIGRDGQVKKTYLGRLKMEELRADLASL
jgi:thiol-disulfide isomerase/thioredoxin